MTGPRDTGPRDTGPRDERDPQEPSQPSSGYGGDQPSGYPPPPPPGEPPGPRPGQPPGQPPGGPPGGPPGQPPGGPGYPPSGDGGINILAVLSLVFAFVFAPAGIVLGHVARKQIADRREEGAGIALAGLILSYIFTGLAVLACCGFLLFGGLLSAADPNTLSLG